MPYMLCLKHFTLLPLCYFHVNFNYCAFKFLPQQNNFSVDSGLGVSAFIAHSLTDAQHASDSKIFEKDSSSLMPLFKNSPNLILIYTVRLFRDFCSFPGEPTMALSVSLSNPSKQSSAPITRNLPTFWAKHLQWE